MKSLRCLQKLRDNNNSVKGTMYFFFKNNKIFKAVFSLIESYKVNVINYIKKGRKSPFKFYYFLALCSKEISDVDSEIAGFMQDH